ncbi:MAG: glycyl-radical enzyme activating protein [Clostridia bacterium]
MTVSHIEPKGLLFDIQRMSLQDGPGVRTSLFFKGCPLHCQWCHNPESYTMSRQLRYQASQCVGCGACESACPHHAHCFAPLHKIARERCELCGKCVEVCCYHALSIIGRQYTVGELLNAVEGDRPYFERKDEQGRRGGLTLTGGEPMAQFAFIRQFVREVREMNLCMETSGFAPTEQYVELLPYIDLFLWDWKASDPEKHKRLCGQDNRLIQTNLEALYRLGANIVLRLPLIPGVNDDLEHLSTVAAWLRVHPNIQEVQIMAYHRMGVDKMPRLGMEAQEVDQPAASEEQKMAWLSFFYEKGLPFVTIG